MSVQVDRSRESDWVVVADGMLAYSCQSLEFCYEVMTKIGERNHPSVSRWAVIHHSTVPDYLGALIGEIRRRQQERKLA